MAAQHPNAPTPATSRTPDEDHPHEQPLAGVVHDNVRHTESFTVVGNHLVQHKELSLLAIGLSCYIQSVRQGTSVDIKTLAARFPEGPTRIAAGLRELEKHGYLERTCTRTSTGRVVTRTVSRNRPGHSGSGSSSARDPAPRPAARRAAQEKPPPRKRLPAVPQPSCPAPALLQAAVDVLTGLRRRDPRLLLSATDAEHLAPGVAAWLEREITATAVCHALTENLPNEPLIRPAALLAHRLTAQLPPPPPFRTPAPPALERRHPLQTCDGCDRAFRAPQPGRCRECRTVDDRVPGAPDVGPLCAAG
ncbi:helix-turn-helix domain-containing protein [Streptomyces sp. KPB2]|uniref:helix-turn-helix domain-containing protein n=1 Tax=Streptomyces TaxID=1883 RepID=UPI000F6FFCB8|nr:MULTISPECIES: helix-turn-helix domain-containing protein [Streptomyces]AZM76637.1 helix-turn-helix domain-containing protein [Streptomyces sp. KPB2]MCX5036581.1 helix-turn-helix domain-containing protein [Streptomyces coelicoflavus]QFX82781.1 helix-turn-helix domain-containing protein [Streptomyces sp. SYP-A7193]QKW62208.1 helix-turn-helix domain-containing protein [Streptomyces sp. NA03103]